MGTCSLSYQLEECYEQHPLQRKQVSCKQLIDAYILWIENTQCLFTPIPSTLSATFLSYYSSDEYIIIYIFMWPDIAKIPLKLHRHRGHRSNGNGGSRANTHPNNLLGIGRGNYYESNGGFKDSENDWIVFKYDALYMPKEIVINNGKSMSLSASMSVSIGSGRKWIAFQPKNMHIQSGKSYQTFKIKGVSYDTIKANSYKKIKVEFMKPPIESIMQSTRNRINYDFINDYSVRQELVSTQYQLDYMLASLKQETSSFTPQEITIYGIKL
eukprot:104724_1